MTPALKKGPGVGNRQENSTHEKFFKKISQNEVPRTMGENNPTLRYIIISFQTTSREETIGFPRGKPSYIGLEI